MPHSQPDVLIKRVLGEAGQAVSFADMAVLGRNPARIIPAICRFTDSRHPRRTRFVDEPVWAGRSLAETTEATRHEALTPAATNQLTQDAARILVTGHIRESGTNWGR